MKVFRKKPTKNGILFQQFLIFFPTLHTDVSNIKSVYVQGMNVVVGVFLYVFPELEAFFAAATFLKTNCPLYCTKDIEGAYAGLEVHQSPLLSFLFS